MADPLDTQQVQTSISRLLGEAAKQLASFLETILPSLVEDWWKQAVVNNLSYQQRRVEQHNIESLGSLDLAALIRVLDQNWYQISTKLNLTSESRHFVKEMQTIRNRWAHSGTDGFPVDDVYLDLDTLMSLVNGRHKLRQKMKALCFRRRSLRTRSVGANGL
jgi:ATP-dependent helicase HepA